jgi:hypothetical protein
LPRAAAQLIAAEAAGKRVVAVPAEQVVVAVIADDGIVESVAEALGSGAAGQRQMLDIDEIAKGEIGSLFSLITVSVPWPATSVMVLVPSSML